MNRKICTVFIIGLLSLSLLSGCELSSNDNNTNLEGSHNEERPDFVKLDVDYIVNDDGTYTCRNVNFDYKVEVSGIDGEKQVTFVILTNDRDTSFTDVATSMTKAEMSMGEPKFVILGWY